MILEETEGETYISSYLGSEWSSNMGGITYKETLELVEELMINSYIRKYCTEICKGKCCENCYNTNPDSCRHHEERRLSCSIYICGDMLCLFSGTNMKFLEWLNKRIKEQYYIYNKIRCDYYNMYFTKPDKTFLEIVRFPKKIKTVIPDINTKKIKSKMVKLIEAKMQIHDSRARNL